MNDVEKNFSTTESKTVKKLEPDMILDQYKNMDFNHIHEKTQEHPDDIQREIMNECKDSDSDSDILCF